ncbi:MAG TPA: tetratricopeptide repeat protein [Candidatus Acidoferrum sp.]|nr:tetratricopeptide repeat protein [Candidatus Acidoferrum sp.]
MTGEGVTKALESQRNAEREFVAEALRSERQPKGWPAALVMFHISMWRERLRDALTEFRHARPYTAPPDNIDEVNDAELAAGIGTPLADAAARSDKLLAELITLAGELGDRPFKWYVANSTVEALLRNSYTHPRLHLVEYLRENGERDRAHRLFEDAVTEMRELSAPPIALGMVIYNLACARAEQGRLDEALGLLEEAFAIRPAIKEFAATDPDLAPLYEDPRFKALVRT